MRDNPFASPSTESAAESFNGRPVGTLLVAAFLLLAAAGVLASRIPLLQHVQTATFSNDLKLLLARDAFTAISGFAAAIGLLSGSRLGWNCSIFHAYWRIGAYAVNAVSWALLESNVPSHFSSVLLGAGIFVLILRYLHKANVRDFFGIHDSVLRINVVSFAVCSVVSLLLRFGISAI